MRKARKKCAPAKKLKAMRKRRGWKQKQLAEIAGLSCSAIWGFEKSRRFPNLHSALKLSKAFGISVEELIEELIGERFRNDLQS